MLAYGGASNKSMPSQNSPLSPPKSTLPPPQASALGDALESLSLTDRASVPAATPQSTEHDEPLLNDLNSEPRRRVIDAIDRLRELGVNKDVPLPQLVVVGDQSSGKSSLLEGLTGIAFPIASDVCTRFVTHFSMKRTVGAEDFLRVFITPGDRSLQNPSHVEQIQSFERVISQESLGNKEDMDTLFADVAAAMGLPANTNDNPTRGQQFSEDILEIEFNGPSQTHLSVIDMPGLFHNTTASQTEQDRVFVINTIKRYIKSENTIILAVMDASNNLANQEVFKMAKEADQLGSRTVGIVTKCDIIQRGDEPSIIRIAQNSVEYLYHGWFAVRNRSTVDIQNGQSMQQRHETEKAFFLNPIWSSLDPSRCGVTALKSYLARVLYEHVRKQLPRIQDDLKRLDLQAQKELQAMGESRESASAQRCYLAKFASEYERMLQDCLSGHYKDNIASSSPLRLETHLLNLREEFRAQMAKFGHAHAFARPDNTVDDSYVDTAQKPFSFFSTPSHSTTSAPTYSFPSRTSKQPWGPYTAKSVPPLVSPEPAITPYVDRDGIRGQAQVYQSICTCGFYRGLSPEELRVSGSKAGLVDANSHRQATGLFGAAASTQSAFNPTSLFSAAASTPSVSKPTNLFGGAASTQPAFNPTSLFSAAASTPSVSKPNSLFGGAASTQPASKPTSIFGGAAPMQSWSKPTGLFGGAASTPSVSKPNSLFGGAASTQPASKPASLFGASISADGPFAPNTSPRSTEEILDESFAGRTTKLAAVNSKPGASTSGPFKFNPGPPPPLEVYQWILENYRSSHGMELPGTVNPELIKSLFQQQTRSWEKVSKDYVSKVAIAIQEYSLEAHEKLVNEDEVRRKLLARHRNHEKTMKQDAEEELHKVLVDERENLTTVNQTYMDNLTLMREERVLSRLRALGLLGEGAPDLDANVNVTNVRSMLKAANPSWEEQAVHDIHDILKAYYEVARDRFMDNVVMAVVKRHLTGEASKLKLYNTTYAPRLLVTELTEIAGESFASASKRSELVRKSIMFKEAIKVVNGL